MLSPSFLNANHAENPQLLYEQMRLEGEVVRLRLPVVGKVWMTVSHRSTASLLKDDSRFSMRRTDGSGKPGGVQWWMPRTIRLLANNMLTSDGDQHRRLRKLVDQAFQRRNVMEMEPQIRSIAHELLDRWPMDRPVDLVTSYARTLPMLVICKLLGVDENKRHEFARQAGRMTTVTGVVDMLKAMLPIWRMKRLVEELIRQERAQPPESAQNGGLIRELVAARATGDQLGEDELIATTFLLLMAGHETTTHAISTGIQALLEDGDAIGWLLQNPARYDLAIEELLRFNSPVQFSKPRIDGQGGEFFGQKLEPGDLVMACLGAANRDPVRFEKPDRLNLSRRPNPHLEFGTGVHFCLGFQLARLEMKIALQVLLERFPSLALMPGGTQWQQRMGLRALSELQVLPNGRRR